MFETPGAVARRYWVLMNTNDWHAVSGLFADEFVLDWPQSRERVRGRENFVSLNAAYPAVGPWSFQVVQTVSNEHSAVTDTLVSDGSRHDRCITFFAVSEGKITRITEYWPDVMEPASERRQWVEASEPDDGP